MEHVHYLAQFLWVTANGIWAFGEIYSIHDAPMSLFTRSRDRWITCRWYACWIVTLALVPIVCMYIIWIFFTCTGRIDRHRDMEMSSQHQHHKPLSSYSRQTDSEDMNQLSITHEQVMFSLIGRDEDSGYDSADFSLPDESTDIENVESLM